MLHQPGDQLAVGDVGKPGLLLGGAAPLLAPDAPNTRQRSRGAPVLVGASGAGRNTVTGGGVPAPEGKGARCSFREHQGIPVGVYRIREIIQGVGVVFVYSSRRK